MKLKKFKLTFILFILCFIIFNIYLSCSIIKANTDKNEIIRLHVVANSNTINDQLIKLKISYKIEDFINSLQLENNNSKEILKILNNNSLEISQIVNTTLKEENITYNHTITIGKIYYDESKQTPIFSMDKGLYNSIKITLGKGEGKNFWNFIAPNKKNIEKIKNFQNILPGINELYNDFNIADDNKHKLKSMNKTTYKSKILDFFNNKL